MSDIRIELGPIELIVLVFLMGWPGLLIGAGIGALAWRSARSSACAPGPASA